MEGWYVRRVESDRGCVVFEVVDGSSHEVIIGGLVNRNEASRFAAVPEMIEALKASQAFISAIRARGRKKILEKLTDTLIKAS